MRTVLLLVVGALLLASIPVAQTNYATVPPSAATQGGNYYDYYTFYYSSSTRQPVHNMLLYNSSLLPAQPIPIKAIYMRRSAYVGNQNYASTATLTIDLAFGQTDDQTMSSTFANNVVASSSKNVFSGQINLPACSHSTLPPWNIKFPCSTPFMFVPASAKSLIVDMTITQFTNTGTSTGSWYLDCFQPSLGSRTTNLTRSGCKGSNGNYCNSISYRMPLLGGQWYVRYNNAFPANAPGIGALGTMGKGSNWLGITLPFDLTPLGAPGCNWGIDIVFTTALTTNTSGQGLWPTINIPNLPALANANFFDDALFLDAQANALGVVSAWSSKWTIGDGAGVGGSYVYKYTDTTPPSPTGSLRSKYTIPLQLEF